MKSIPIDSLIKDMNLEIIYKPERTDIEITEKDINRPGLQLTGFYNHFAYERIQLIGNVEWSYLTSLDEKTRDERIKRLLEYRIPAIIITRNLEVFPEMVKWAKEFGRTILRTKLTTTKFTSRLINYLDDMLAPQITIHGVLVEVYGIGILITGKSGVGKSETALELIKRGHRLIADDAVEIRKVEENILRGRAPELIKYFLEIRGIGILDIKKLYGVWAVRNSKIIDLVVELEYWDDKKEYDRVLKSCI